MILLCATDKYRRCVGRNGDVLPMSWRCPGDVMAMVKSLVESRDGVIIMCNSNTSNFTIIVIVMNREKMKVIVVVIVIDGQIIDNSLFLQDYSS